LALSRAPREKLVFSAMRKLEDKNFAQVQSDQIAQLLNHESHCV
jgi:hypothetical protein